ncbi:MAG: hypothetical protein IJ410_06105 [Oscillospiraceae bacterium]|nr:hypothetical protein [Oscillospiraceae bacterium]
MDKIKTLYEKYKYFILIAAVLGVAAVAWVSTGNNPPGTTGFIVKRHYALPPYFMYEGNLYRGGNKPVAKTELPAEVIFTTETEGGCEAWQLPDDNLESNAWPAGTEMYFLKDEITCFYTYNPRIEKYLKWELVVDKPVIAVTDHTNGGQRIIVPMLKYDGRLYTVAEFDSDNGDYGTVDGGTVTDRVPLTEIPAENGTSNFLPEGTILKVAADGSFINCRDYSNLYMMKPVN